MRIGIDGNLLVGSTSNNASAAKVILKYGSGENWGLGPVVTQPNNFYVLSGLGVGLYLASGNTAWTANSDERLKDIIEPIAGASEKVSTIRAVIGRYKADAEGTRRSFVIAQDVLAVLPEAVNVQGDEAGTLGVQYTDLIPLLIAAVTEHRAEIAALTSRLAALEPK